MIQTTNECCNCATEMYPCIGTRCRKIRAKHLFCDHCFEEVERLFLVDDKQVCADCLPEMFEMIDYETAEG